MTLMRVPYFLVGAAAGLGSVLWLDGIVPPAGLAAVSAGAATILHALVVLATATLAMLATAAGALVASDWQVDVQSRQARAQLELRPAELSRRVDPETAWDIDPRYLVPAANEALRQVFRAHCFPSSIVQTIAEVSAVSCAPRTGTFAEPMPVEITRDAAPKISRDQGIGIDTWAVSEAEIPGRALLKPVSSSSGDAWTVATNHRGTRAKLGGRRASPQTRLVANADAWSRRLGPDLCVVTERTPGWRTADIIILGSSQDDLSRPLPDAATGNIIASGTEAPSCRGPPQVVGHPSRAAGTTSAKLSSKKVRPVSGAGALPAEDLVVRDNLGDRVPVCARELDVIETYLDQVLRELLASSTVGSGSEPA
jgi:hypothetical protein